LIEKRNHTWCELGHDSRSGVKEGGIGLLDLDSGVLKKINQQIHRITKHMLKKIKTEIDRKKKSYLVRVGTRFKVGCERGRD
jgi:hypothetical protein